MKHPSQSDFQCMDKTKFEISSMDEKLDDRTYWLSQSAESRIQHIEMLRMVNYGAKAASRLQRIFEVAELP